MKRLFLVMTLLCSLVSSGCAPFRSSLKEGESLPSGKVLLIGAVALDPPVEQGDFVHHDVMGASKGVMRVALTRDLSQKVDVNSLASLSIEEALLMKMKESSFIPLQPGVRYIRLGIVDLSSRASRLTMPAGPSGSAGFKGIDVSSLYLVRDLKLDLPEGVKAVYVGTIIFKHDGTKATGVKVRDDFKQALKELAAMKIDGLSSKDVVKKLAHVVNH